MNLIKRFTILLMAFVSLLPLTVNAEVWTPETLPMVHLQDSLRFVCNPDGVLSEETVRKTDAILAQLKRTKGIETVVAVVRKLKNGDPYQFGMDLSRKYGIGDKEQRTGLIIILSTEDRAYQFLTGHGLEGTLPDGLCYNIQQTEMVPALKEGKWDEAIYKSVEAVNGIIMGDESITRRYTEKGNNDMSLSVIIVIIMLIIFVFAHKSAVAEYKCPKCKTKNALKKIKSRRIRRGSEWCTVTTWRCEKCGHILEREKRDSDNNSNTGSSFPFFMTGGGGGGGFSGGSFGGGSFGGGGAGGRF